MTTTAPTTVKGREAFYNLRRELRQAQTDKIEGLLREGGKTHKAIAAECGCSEKTIQPRLRAMEQRAERAA